MPTCRCRAIRVSTALLKLAALGHRAGVLLSQPGLQAPRAAESGVLQDADKVCPGQDDDWVSVLADHSVGLLVQVGRRDEHPELTVPQPADEPGDFPDSHSVARPVALGLESDSSRTRSAGGPIA